MIWASRGGHMAGNMTPLLGIPLSLEGYPRALLAWLYIQRPSKSVMMWVIGQKKQNNMIDQKT